MDDQTKGADFIFRPGEALETILAGAAVREPLIELNDGQRFALVPEGMSIKDVSDKFALPPSIREAVTVDDADSLIAYTNRFCGLRSIIVADLDRLRVTSFLDWHSANDDGGDPLAAQPVKHTATLQLRDSVEYARWAAFENTLHDQAVFAEFLDENSADIIDPDPAVMIEIARDLEATTGVAFKAGNRLQTGERSFRYETETHVKGDLVVPQRFRLSIPLFMGEEPTEIEASFRFRPQPDGLKLGFVWRRVEYVRQAQFRQIAFRVAEATGRPVIQGRRSNG